jgi:hypothetical protein
MMQQTDPPNKRFCLEEATIDELHRAIKAGEITCLEVVQRYIERVRAYNGVCSMLVTEDGAPVPLAAGPIRAQQPVVFPTATVKASAVLPDLNKHKGLALEFGRMEPTASDSCVQQQFGMIVGIPNAGQVNALATLNIRGERSVTCRGDFDLHPSKGPLPPGAPVLSPISGRARTRGRTGRQIQTRPRSPENADVWCGFLVQGLVRYPRHALDRRRRRCL